MALNLKSLFYLWDIPVKNHFKLDFSPVGAIAIKVIVIQNFVHFILTSGEVTFQIT